MLRSLFLKCCFTSTETVGLLGTGAQYGHLDFHTKLRSVLRSASPAPLKGGCRRWGNKGRGGVGRGRDLRERGEDFIDCDWR